jgi:type II secretory pathway component GspD/PulD (secretin)
MQKRMAFLLALVMLVGISVCFAEEVESWKGLLDLPPNDLQTHVVKVLRTTNKAQTNRYVAKVYTMENVNPYEVINFLTTTLTKEEGGFYTFVEPDNVGGKILVICPVYQLEYFDKVVPQLDRPQLTSAPGSKYTYYRLKHRSAADPGFVAVLRDYANPGGVIQPDLETNSVLLFDSPSGADFAEQALNEKLDVPTPQAQIDVKMYEIALNNDGKMGLDYEDWKNGPGRYLFAAQYSWEYLKAAQQLKVKQYGNYLLGTSSELDNSKYERNYKGAGYYADYPSAFVDFLVEKGKARVLVDTKIVALTGVSAALNTGDQILYYAMTTDTGNFTREVNGASASRSVPENTQVGVSAVSTGVFLDVIPTIGSEDVNLDLIARVVNLLGFQENGTPILGSRQLENQFRVKNGEEILLGGLTRERQINSTEKIPILGSLPVLGWLFGGETTTMQKSMIVISLKPEIIKDFRNLSPEDETVINKATGVAEVSIPTVEVGFDQYLFDTEM